MSVFATKIHNCIGYRAALIVLPLWSNMSLIKKFAGQAAIYGLGSILSRIVYYLVVVVLLTYILGERTAEFGTYAFFYAYATVLITLFSFRMDTALFRYGNKGKDLDTAFNTTLTLVLGSAALLALLGIFLARPIANLIGFPDQPRYVTWFAFILSFDCINLIPFAKLRLTDKAKQFALYKIFNVVISIGFILFFLVVLPRYEDSFLGFLPKMESTIDWVFISNLIASALLTLALLPSMRGFKVQINKPLISKMLVYVFPLVIVGMANGFIQFFAVPLQKAFLGNDVMENLGDAGVYDFTRRIAGLFVMFTTAFNYAAEPFFFNNSSEADRKNLYGKICRLFVLVGGIAIVGLYLGVDLVKYLADSNYWDSLYLLPILLLAYMFLGIYYNISIWYKLSDNTKYGAYISIIGVVITLGFSIFYLPRIGYAASAWATLITYAVMVVIGYWLGQKKYPIHYPVIKIARDLLVIIAILGVGYCVRESQAVRVKYIVNAFLFLAYLSYVWYSEKDQWKTVLGRSG